MQRFLVFLLPMFISVGCSADSYRVVSPVVNHATSTSHVPAPRSSVDHSPEPAAFRGTLSSHNSVRRQLGLKPLRWSNRLAGYAQQWANHLASTQNCFMQHRPRHGRFKQIHGENLFWASPKRWSDGRVEKQQISISEVIKSWADEDVDYDYRSNRCRPGAQCGHYTQIVWRETEAVGCAKVMCRDKSQLWVCNYDPPGNYIGERPY